jgi:hypothetical protein
MFYTKNVPSWERIVRIAMGIAGVAFALEGWGQSAAAVGVGLMGAMIAMTGLVGFCPMCALVGRRLDKKRT